MIILGKGVRIWTQSWEINEKKAYSRQPKYR